ncbi:MAG: MFS transporter [Chloroflexi bacterium]|nr:MFS transporter [Chloroflexota bacterium]
MKFSAQHKTLVALTLINAGDGVINTMFSPFLKGLGLPVSSIGLVVAVFAFASLLSRLPAGLVHGPSRTKPLMYISLAILCASTVLYTLTYDAVLLTLFRIVHGISFGVASTLNMAIFMDTLSTTRNRTRAMAFFSALMAGGFSSGHAASGFLIDSLGYGPTFIIAGLISATGALFTSDPQRESVAAATRHAAQANASLAAGTRSKLAYALSPRMLVISLMAFSLNLVQHVSNTFFPLYALGVGLSLSSVGFLRSLQAASGLITRPFSGEATRFARYDVMSSGGLAAVCISIALLPSFDSMGAFVPLFALLGTARGVVMVANTIAIVEDVGSDANKRGIASGVFNMARDLGGVAGPVIGGMVASIIGVEGALRFTPIAFLGLFLVLHIVGPARQAMGPAKQDARSGPERMDQA